MQKTRCQPVFDRNASNWTAIAFASAMTIGLPWLALPAFGAVSPPTSVVSWGHESSGTIVPLDLGDAVAVRSSGNFSLAIRADGTVAVWGDPFPGTPEALAQVHDAKMISLGYHHGLLVHSNGVVTAWGSGDNGENTVPPNLTNVVAVAAGTFNSLALLQDGTVVAWGANNYGQSDVPHGLSNVVAIAANTANNSAHSLALKGDGTVVCWGENFAGQCTVPEGLSNVTAIAAGSWHSLALRADGTVVAWGNNETGQTNVPAGLSNVTAIAAGPGHNLALMRDGQVVTWGYWWPDEPNEVPPGLSKVVAISAGFWYSLALSASQQPFIRTQPGSKTVGAEIDGAEFFVDAFGPPPLSYQWRKDGVDMPGITNRVIWVHGSLANAGDYQVVVSNPFGSVTSQVAHLTLLSWVHITSLPESQASYTDDNVTFRVEVEGIAPIAFQWQKDGSDLLDATNATLTLNLLHLSDAGDYTVVVFNDGESVRSTAAHLTVLSPVAPSILMQPRSEVLFAGAQYFMSVIATGGPPPQYQWHKNGLPLPGETNSALHFSAVTSADAAGYLVVASNRVGIATSRVATLSVLPAPARTFPAPSTVVMIGGPEQPDGLTNIIAIAAGRHHVLALNQNRTVVSWGSAVPGLPGLPPPNQPPPGLSDVVAIAAGDEYSLALKADGTITGWGSIATPEIFGVVAIAAGDQFGLAIKVDGSVASWGADVMRPPVPNDLTGAKAGGIAIRASAILKNDGSVMTFGTAMNPALLEGQFFSAVSMSRRHLLLLKQDGTVVDYQHLNPGTGNSAPTDLSAVIAISAGANHSLALKDDGMVVQWDGALIGSAPTVPASLTHVSAVAGGENFSVALTDWPVILELPADTGVNAGESLTWTVRAGGPPPLRYQWLHNGVAIAGATNAAFELANVQADDAGGYSVTVSTFAGNVTSGPVQLTVNLSPVITLSPRPETVFAGAFVAFRVEFLGALPMSVQWRKEGVDLAGETQNRLPIPRVQSGDAGDYQVVLVNSWGSVTSAPVSLRVISKSFSFPDPGTVVSLGGPLPPPGLDDAVAVAAGDYHALALRRNGTVVAWGGLPSPGSDHVAPPPGLSNVVAIAAGHFISLALKDDGTVVMWGGGPRDVLPEELYGVVAVAVTHTLNVALKSDGSVVSWGRTIGPGPPPLEGVIDVGAGFHDLLALQDDGHVAAWGIGAPLFIASLNQVKGISANFGHFIVLLQDGTVRDYRWDESAESLAPPDLTGVIKVAAGYGHGLALKQDGTLVGWNGPAIPPGVTNVTAISGGNGFSVFITRKPPAPVLAAMKQAETPVLVAPVSVSGFILEAADVPTGPFLPVDPGLLGTNGLPIWTPGQASQRFFRLNRP